MMEHLPPVKLFLSNTVTEKPARESLAAIALPPTPAPTTIAVGFVGAISYDIVVGVELKDSRETGEVSVVSG